VAVISMKELLEAGVHFGHQTRRWNPKCKRFIYSERNGIYIIDLHQTLRRMEQACKFVRETVAKGGKVLFVGTKRQAQEAVRSAAERCSQYHVNQRWLGGMLTNWPTMTHRIERLRQLRRDEADGMFDVLPKKEAASLREQLRKLELYFNGIETMGGLPGAVFVVDLKKEHIAVTECNKLKIPVIGILDTNCDPDLVDYPVPGNDDAIRAIRLIAGKLADSALEGQMEAESRQAEADLEGMGHAVPDEGPGAEEDIQSYLQYASASPDDEAPSALDAVVGLTSRSAPLDETPLVAPPPGDME
jgi:small subunit ribosomal protein S2